MVYDKTRDRISTARSDDLMSKMIQSLDGISLSSIGLQAGVEH